MLARLAADALVLVHLAFIVFAMIGGLFVAWRARIAWLHLPTAAWAAAIEFSGTICPLTPLENSLRVRGGEAGYSGGFIDHYITALIYPDGLTRTTQIAIGSGVLIMNVVLYALVIRRQRKGGR